MKAIINAHVVLLDQIIENGYILFDDERIVKTGSMDEFSLSEVRETIDAAGCYAGPGFIDIHCHAGGDYWAYENPDSVALHHLKGGATSMLLTLYHDIGVDGAKKGAEKIKDAMQRNSPGNIAGIHFEGPFLSNKYGAHKQSARLPDPEEYTYYLEHFGDIIKHWTFSPELPDTDAFLEAVKAHDIPLAIGHSEASPERVIEVYQKGVRLCTHITNASGCSITPTRYGGTLEVTFDHAAMLCDNMFCEIINDSEGAHVRPLMSQLIVKTVGIDRVVGVTDACTGDPGESDVNIINGGLYGSKLRMINVARNFKNNTKLSVIDIFKVCSTNPARAIQLSGVGDLNAGSRSNMVVVTPDFDLKTVVLNGRTVLPEGEA